jgi:hypothetical protein
VFSDIAGTIAHPSPLLANAAGVFPQVFAPKGVNVKAVVATSAGATLYTLDPVTASDAAAVAPAAAGRLVVNTFAEIATTFGYTTAGGRRQVTAGGVKLNVLPRGGQFVLDDFGAFTGTLTGSRDNAVINTAVTAAAGRSLRVGDGPYDFSSYPAGINDAFLEGTPFANFSNLDLPLHTPVYTGNQQVALAACVLRYYDAGVVSPGSPAAWYILSAKSGAWHEPVLAGPVLASGAGSVLLKLNIGDFGLDEEKWTPAGLVCGPDEGFVANGVEFGASVDTGQMTIKGSFTSSRTCMVTWTATGVGAGTLTGSNAPYIFTTNADGIVSGWTGSGTARSLRLFRDPNQERKAYPAQAITPIIACRRSGAAALGVFGNYRAAGTQTVGGTVYSYYDVLVDRQSDATQITDASNVSFTLTMDDPMALPPAFVFNQDPGAGSNIFIVGVFRRRPDTLPA